jgi:hypothetical protein
MLEELFLLNYSECIRMLKFSVSEPLKLSVVLLVIGSLYLSFDIHCFLRILF